MSKEKTFLVAGLETGQETAQETGQETAQETDMNIINSVKQISKDIIDFSPERFLSEEMIDIIEYLINASYEEKRKLLMQDNVYEKFLSYNPILLNYYEEILESIENEDLRLKLINELYLKNKIPFPIIKYISLLTGFLNKKYRREYENFLIENKIFTPFYLFILKLIM